MTTPPTRFHQNNKIIRYIHTKNCQNHSPFTNPHSPLHHPTLLGIYEKKVDYSQFSWSQAQQIYCCFSFNKEKKKFLAGPPPFLSWKIFKIQKTPKNSLSKTVCFFINFLALLLWMILFKKVVCGLSFSPDFECQLKPYEWVFSTFLLLWKNFQQIVESYQMIFFARLKRIPRLCMY